MNNNSPVNTVPSTSPVHASPVAAAAAPPKPRTEPKTFSSFRVAEDAEGHYLEVRLSDLKWYAAAASMDGGKTVHRRFKDKAMFLKWLREQCRMVPHPVHAPYCMDAKDEKFPCWHAGIAENVRIDQPVHNTNNNANK